MPSVYTILRYTTYGIFVVCNAIVASIAVWVLSLAQATSKSASVESYLIFLGSFALVFLFSIIFTRLLRNNAFTNRVWFECAWSGLFFFMELVGASLATGIPVSFCSATDAVSIQPTCILASHVLQAFTWTCTVILMCYFLFMVAFSCIHHYQDGYKIWQCKVRHFPALGAVSGIGTMHHQAGTASPMLERFISGPPVVPTIAAPKPRHPPRPLVISSGLSQYEVEYYRPPSPPPPLPTRSRSGRSRNRESENALQCYPDYIQSSLNHPPATYQPSTRQQTETYRSSPSPPPLGDWPRPDIIKRPQPERSARPKPEIPTASSPSAPSSFRQRPSGPRSRSMSGGNIPGALDLSKVPSSGRRGQYELDSAS